VRLWQLRVCRAENSLVEISTILSRQSFAGEGILKAALRTIIRNQQQHRVMRNEPPEVCFVFF
jgi:hypothetical protein